MMGEEYDKWSSDISKAAVKLYACCLTGVGIQEAKEDFYILYNSPVAVPDSAFCYNQKEPSAVAESK